MACPNCGTSNVRRAERGAVFDQYTCRSCSHGFSRMSPGAKRTGIIAGFTLLTAGMDLGFIGAAIAALMPDDDGSDET